MKTPVVSSLLTVVAALVATAKQTVKFFTSSSH